MAGFDPQDYDIQKISEQTTSDQVLPTDKIPIIRYDTEEQDYSNFTVPVSLLGVMPTGYLKGFTPSVVKTSSAITSVSITAGVARDSTNSANIISSATVTNSSTIWGDSTRPTGTNITVYILAARKSAEDNTVQVFLSQTRGGAIGGFEYSVAVGKGLYSYNGTTESISNVVGFDNEIISVQTTDITPGTTPLANGKIILVLE